jgi:hypothetical protein
VFPNLSPLEEALKEFFISRRTPMTALPGKKIKKRQLAEHGDFPSTEQNFSLNFEKYLKIFALL